MTNKLIIYNLETDSKSKVMASAVDWVDEISKYFDEVRVYSTHVGEFQLPPNVTVVEMGGGDLKRKVIGIWRMYKSTYLVRNSKNTWSVFHHMSSRSCLVLGWYYRLKGVRQVLWYSHNHASLDLRISYKFIDVACAPTISSFPLSNTRVLGLGHAVKIHRGSGDELELVRSGIVSLGRIAEVKNLELLSTALRTELVKNDSNLQQVTLIGPIGHEIKYAKELLADFSSLPYQFEYLGALEHEKALKALNKFSLYFTGTPKSVDKATIEAGMSGCLIVSESLQALELTGMTEVWRSLGFLEIPSLDFQIWFLQKLDGPAQETQRKTVKEISRTNNSFEKTILKIVDELKGP